MSIRSYALQEFWEAYSELPESIRALADKQYQLFDQNPRHPSLQFKAVGPFWSVRVTRDFRALGIRRDDSIFWFWIGRHEEYDRILAR